MVFPMFCFYVFRKTKEQRTPGFVVFCVYCWVEVCCFVCFVGCVFPKTKCFVYSIGRYSFPKGSESGK